MAEASGSISSLSLVQSNTFIEIPDIKSAEDYLISLVNPMRDLSAMKVCVSVCESVVGLGDISNANPANIWQRYRRNGSGSYNITVYSKR